MAQPLEALVQGLAENKGDARLVIAAHHRLRAFAPDPKEFGRLADRKLPEFGVM